MKIIGYPPFFSNMWVLSLLSLPWDYYRLCLEWFPLYWQDFP